MLVSEREVLEEAYESTFGKLIAGALELCVLFLSRVSLRAQFFLSAAVSSKMLFCKRNCGCGFETFSFSS